MLSVRAGADGEAATAAWSLDITDGARQEQSPLVKNRE